MKTKLRALTRIDLPITLRWHNQQEIQDLYAGHPFPVNEEFENAWYDKILTNNFPTTVFGVEHIKDKKLIGLFLLKDISLINRKAELAIYIGDANYKGQGLSKEILQQGLEFGYNKLGLNRIDLKVIDNNSVAIKLYTSSGFIKEGSLRESVYKNGEFRDEIQMSLLKDEFNV